MDFFELLHGKELAFLTKRVQKWSTEESYLSLKEVVVPIRMFNDCAAERYLGLVTDCHIDRITRSDEQKFHFYLTVTEQRSRMKKIGEKKGLSKKFLKQVVLNREFDHRCFNKLLVARCFSAIRYYCPVSIPT